MSTTDTAAATAPVLSVRCLSWRSFADTYAVDLEQGALRLTHPHELPPLTVVSVELSLPDSISVRLSARIVQASAQAHGAYSFALELLDLEGERKQQLAQLLSFARTQLAGDDAHSSFTHTLLQVSPSIPPREVGLRLSQLPTARPSLAPRHSRAPRRETVDNDRTESGYRHCATTPPGGEEITQPLSPGREGAARPSGSPGADASPSDPLKLKALLSNVAHKHYDAAMRIANEMLEQNSRDVQARRWRALCQARIAIKRNDTALAVQAYQAVLHYEPSDREAREYVKAHERAKRLESIPFGRFFARKK